MCNKLNNNFDKKTAKASMGNRWKKTAGAITAWKDVLPVLDSERLYIALNDLEAFTNKYGVLPKLDEAFDMFRMVTPDRVKVLVVAQSPYPGCCPTTGTPYACGPAFLTSKGCATTPATLRNIMSELYRDFSEAKVELSPQYLVIKWINQGVMLLNSSLTIGTGCPEYLKNHSVLWHEIMQDIICTICKKLDPIIVLVGKDAWEMGKSLLSTDVIRVSHPVARGETSVPWFGSGVFSKVSAMMVKRGYMPIKWV